MLASWGTASPGLGSLAALLTLMNSDRRHDLTRIGSHSRDEVMDELVDLKEAAKAFAPQTPPSSLLKG